MYQITETSPKTIAILGANGRLSREVARAFHANGWRVRAVTRNGRSPALTSCQGMEFAAANAMNREEVIAAVEGVDVIFNGLNPPYTDWREKAMPMAVNVMAAARQTGALHLFPGNVYNFGSTLPAELTPDTLFMPDHSKADIRCGMEELFAQNAKEHGVQSVIVRAGDFFGGDGTGSWFDEALITQLKKGKIMHPGNRKITHAWAYLPDLAQTFVKLAAAADTLGAFEVFHFEGHNVSGDDMHAAVEKAMGRKLMKSALPRIFVTVAGWFSPKMREIGDVFYLWQKPHALKDPRIESVSGPVPHTALDDAVRTALAGQGWPGNAKSATYQESRRSAEQIHRKHSTGAARI